jgi:hypothetical protein
MVYNFKAKVPTFFYFNYNFNFNFKMLKHILHQLQAMFICYPTIYDLTMSTLVSHMKLIIEWKYPVYPDSIINAFPSWCGFPRHVAIRIISLIIVTQMNTIKLCIIHTHTHTHTHTHARARARAHTHTHTNIYDFRYELNTY